MGNFPIRFGDGQGLEVSTAYRTQGGLVALENAELSTGDTVEKRTGAAAVSLQRSADPVDLIPAGELRALWHRDGELVLETDRRLYSRQKCVAEAAGAVSAGTATAKEIADAGALLEARVNTFTAQTTLAPDPAAATVRARAARPDLDTVVGFDPGTGTGSLTLKVVNSSGQAYLSWDDGDGEVLLPLRASGEVTRGRIATAVPTASSVQVSYLGLAGGSPALFTDFLDFPTGDPDDAKLTALSIFAVAGGIDAADFAMAGSNVQTGTPGNQGRVVAYFERVGSQLLTLALHDESGNRRTRIGDTGPAGIIPYRMDLAVFGVASPFDVDVVFGRGEADSENFRLISAEVPFSPPGDSSTLDVGVGSIKSIVVSTEPGPVAVMADPTGPEPLRSVQTFLGLGVGPVMEFAPGALTWRFVDLAGDELLFHVVRHDGSVTYKHEWDGVGEISAQAEPDVDDSAWAVQGGALFGALCTNGVAFEVVGDIRDVIVPGRNSAGVVDVAHVGAFATGTRVGAIYSFVHGEDLWLRVGMTPGDVGAIDGVVPQLGAIPGPVAIDVISDLGASDAVFRIAVIEANGRLSEFTWNSVTMLDEAMRGHGMPAAVSALTLGITPGGGLDRSLVGVEYTNDNREIFESDPPTPLWVRVDPGLLSLPGGNWSDRGPWTRMYQRVKTRRQFNTTLLSTEAVQITAGSEETPCTILVHDVEPPMPADPSAPQGVVLDVFGGHHETTSALAPLGTRPHVGKVSDTLAVYSYLDSGLNVLFQLWAPTEALSPAPTGITCTVQRIYDMHTREVGGVGYVVFAAIEAGQARHYQVRDDQGTLVAELLTAVAPDVVTDIVAYILPDQLDGFVWVAVGTVGDIGGTPHGEIYMFKVTPGAPGSMAQQWVSIFNPGAAGHAIVVEATEPTSIRAWVEVDNAASSLRNVEFWELDDAPSATEFRPALRDMAIYSTLESIAGEPAGWLSLLGPDKVRRSGLVLFAPGSGEVIGRCCVGRVGGGRTEDLDQRKDRSAKNTMTIGAGGEYLLAANLFPDGQPFSAVTIEMSPGDMANDVPTIGGTAVSAHGGYARAYAGGLGPDAGPVEHDWHELPQFSAIPFGGPGNLGPGSYEIAVTWRWHDSNGLRYRSEPTRERVVLPDPDPDNIVINYRGLSITERVGIVIEVWRTNRNTFGTFRLAATVPNDPLSSTLSLVLSETDAEIAANEQLDAVSLGLVPSAPATATDFMALVGHRLYTRDPERGSRVWFSHARAAGVGVAWAIGQVLETPDEREVVAVRGFDGRVILLTDSTAATVGGSGPSETGASGFTPVRDVPVPIGADRQSSTVDSPYGTVYGPPAGNEPRILDRGLSSTELGNQVAGAFEDVLRAQRVAVAVYQPALETLFLFDDGPAGSTRRSLRWHATTGRWSSDTHRQAHDATVSAGGELAILTTDLRVLVADDSYTDGGLNYVFRVKTPWIRQGSGQGYPWFTLLRVTLFGQYLGAHDLFVDLFADYESEPRYQYRVPAAVLAAQAAAGGDYSYQLPPVDEQVSAVSIQVRDGGEPNATFRLEGVDVLFQGSGDAGPADFPAERQMDPVTQ